MNTENKKIIFRGKCPTEDCGSSDAFVVYEDVDKAMDGYCYSCKTYFNSKQIESLVFDAPSIKEATPSFSNKTVEQILEFTVFADIPDRGIRKDICEMLGIRVSFNAATGEIEKHYYPYYRDGKLIGFKVRDVATKSFSSVGDLKKAELFGQQLYPAGGKMLIITEGELDAASALQMLIDSGKRYRVASLPNGANEASIKNNFQWINQFDSVFLNLDGDGPGENATKKISELLPPGKTHLMRLTEKDASALLQAGKTKEYLQAVFSAATYRPEGIVGIQDIIEEAMKPVEPGLSWPWESLTKFTYGYRRKEVYGFGAGSGAGKTEAFKEVINHVCWEHNLPVGIFFLEEDVVKTAKVLAGKHRNKRFHIVDGSWDFDELREALMELNGKVFMFNHFGAKDWDSIKAKMRFMNKSLGVRDFFIDHLTALVAQEENEYFAMNRIMEEIASLAHELDCTIFYISHLVKTNPPHEEGGHVSASHFRGSGAIIFWSNFLFGIERNQMAEDVEERNTATFKVLKDRNTGEGTGCFMKMKYNHDTGRWLEKQLDDNPLEDTWDESDNEFKFL